MKLLKYRSAAFLLASRLDPSNIERLFREDPLRPSTELEFVSKVNVKVAAVQMELYRYHNLQELIHHLKQLTDSARKQGAQLVSFPEYVGLLPLMISPTLQEMVGELADALQENDKEQVNEILQFFNEHLSSVLFSAYYNIFALLANQSKMYIHAGSTLLFHNNKFVERSFLFGPDGEAVLEQDKLFLSPWEKELGICAGTDLELTETPLGRIAILPGQDSFYFEPAKVASQLGAQLLLCPVSPIFESNDMAHRCGPWMRCQEQPLFALSSCLIGSLDDKSLQGKASVYGPFHGGIAAQCESDEEAVLVDRIDMDSLAQVSDPYAVDRNELLSPQLEEAYRDFPDALERLPERQII